MNSRVTVILPVYNGMPYLQDAVKSVLGQTFAEFTFMIIDDGSTDASAEFLQTLRDPRILVIHQANVGQGAARKMALRSCQTEYVAFMDQDDISLPDRFAKQVEYLDAHSRIVIVGTQIEFLIGSSTQRALSAPTTHEEIDACLLRGRAGICCPSLMFRSTPAKEIDDYPSGMLGEDIAFCLCMSERGRIGNLEGVHLQYRLHSAQTSLAKSGQLIRSNRYAAYCGLCRRSGLQPKTFERFLNNASLFSRLHWNVEAWELIQYRTGRIHIANGRWVRGFIRLALLGVCRPFKAIQRIAQTVRTSFKQSLRVGQRA